MRKRHRLTAALIMICIILSGCTGGNAAGDHTAREPVSPVREQFDHADMSKPELAEEDTVIPSAIDSTPEQETNYIDSLVQETVARFYEPGMSEYEMAKAAFDYMLETTTLVDPVGLDIWRICGSY